MSRFVLWSRRQFPLLAGLCFLGGMLDALAQASKDEARSDPRSSAPGRRSLLRTKLPRGDLGNRCSVCDTSCFDLNDLACNHLADRIIAIDEAELAQSRVECKLENVLLLRRETASPENAIDGHDV